LEGRGALRVVGAVNWCDLQLQCRMELPPYGGTSRASRQSRDLLQAGGSARGKNKINYRLRSSELRRGRRLLTPCAVPRCQEQTQQLCSGFWLLYWQVREKGRAL